MSQTVPKKPQKAKKRAALELWHREADNRNAPLPDLPLPSQLREISTGWQLCQSAAAEAGLEHLMAPQHL